MKSQPSCIHKTVMLNTEFNNYNIQLKQIIWSFRTTQNRVHKNCPIRLKKQRPEVLKIYNSKVSDWSRSRIDPPYWSRKLPRYAELQPSPKLAIQSQVKYAKSQVKVKCKCYTLCQSQVKLIKPKSSHKSKTLTCKLTFQLCNEHQ